MQKNIQSSAHILGIFSQAILQCRNSPLHPLIRRLPEIQQQLQKCHLNSSLFRKQSVKIIQKQQFGIKNKLIKAYQSRKTDTLTIQIILILKNKENNERVPIQKWVLKTTDSKDISNKQNQENVQPQIYLFEHLIRALRCQIQYNELLASNKFEAQEYIITILTNSHAKLQQKNQPNLKYKKVIFDISWQKSVFFQDFNSTVSISSFYKGFQPIILKVFSFANNQQTQNNKQFENKVHFQPEQLVKQQSFSDETFQSTEQMLLANQVSFKNQQKHQKNSFHHKRKRIDSVYQIKDKELDFTVVSHRKISQQSNNLHHSQVQNQISVSVQLSIIHQQVQTKEQQVQSSGEFQILDYEIQQKTSNQIIQNAWQKIQSCLQQIDQELQEIL